MRQQFRSLTGAAPAGIWSAPGRVNLIGEHTDYNLGFVLPIAIDRRTFVAAGPRTDGRIRGWSMQEAESFDVDLASLLPGSLDGWAAYACGPAWVLAQEVALAGADLVVSSDVPLGAGLSSSAALQTAVSLALAGMAERALSGTELAMVAHRAESDFVGVPVGIMDQMISALGRRDTALFLDTSDVSYEHVPFHPNDSGLVLVVIDTGVKHSLGEGQYAQRRRTCEEAAGVLGVASLREATLEQLDSPALTEVQRRRARHVVTENERVLEVVSALLEGDLEAVGSAFVRSHRSLQHDFEVSSPELDVAVEAALESGAVGARMTGGGFGGSAIALVPVGSTGALAVGVEEAFGASGFASPRLFQVAASDGAASHG
ncbi:MAG TPA: galactokinase [Actinomycetota bacterium]|nr:galactokinase [Actinomycetota bacterium]